MRFNPPPNWPQPPEGWSPPPGWQPDPSWPQAPFGWPLWVEEDEAFISPGHAPTVRGTQLPWYRRTVTVVLSLIFFFPVGLVLLWMRPDWPVRRRGAITAVVAVLVIIIGATNNPPPSTTTQLSPTTGAGSSNSSADTSAAASPSSAVLPPASVTPAVSTPPKSSAPAAVVPPAPAVTTHAAPAPAPSTRAPAPPAPSTQAPPPRPSTCGAPSNPYGYNFCGTGGFVSSPPGDICRYFNCISNFWNGHGYMVECNDGMYSMSGGIRGACSYHNGEDRPVYSG